MNSFVSYTLDRLQEPSSWAAIGSILIFIGMNSGQVENLVSSGPGIAGGLAALLAVFIPEKSAPSGAQGAAPPQT